MPIQIIFFFFIFIPSLIYSQKLPLSNTDGGTPSIVNGCVSVIKDDYMESSCDLLIKGPDPLVFERFYCGSLNGYKGFYRGWRANYDSEIIANYPRETNEVHIEYTNKDGRTVIYYGPCALTKGTTLKFLYHENKGFTTGHRKLKQIF